MKTILALIGTAALLEFKVYQWTSREYSESTSGVLLFVAILGTILSGAIAPRRFMSFCGSIAISAPRIAYSMLGPGELVMGGTLHAMVFGMMGVGSFVAFHRRRDESTLRTPDLPL